MNPKKIKRYKDLSTKEKKVVANQFKSMFDELITSFSKILSTESENIEEAVEKHIELVLPLLRKSKLWYNTSMPIEIPSALRQIAEQEKNVTVEEIENIFIYHYSTDNYIALKEMISGWFRSTFFEQRRGIIEDALEAHILGKFTLSVPTLLPQIEGILSSTMSKTAGQIGQLFKEALEKGTLNEVGSFNNLESDLLIALATDPFLFKGQIGEFFSPEKYNEWVQNQSFETTPLNRHAILHGVQIDYATEANSLRVFMLLDSISKLDDDFL